MQKLQPDRVSALPMNPTLLACCLLAGCALVPVATPRAGHDTPEAAAPPLPATSPHAAAPECPADLALDRGARPIAAFQAMASTRPPRLAPGHKQKLVKVFGVAPEDAVARVVAIEAKYPGLVPSGFRDAVLASPRDAALRSRMAECEARHPETLRRAGYDAALAFLLGGERTVNAQRADVLAAGMDATPAQREFYFISKHELEIEDVLTRALYREHRRIGNDAFARWAQVFLHSCGAFACNVVDRSAGFGDPDWISWDLRDGGTITAHDAGPERKQHEAQCRAHTGYLFREECITGCDTTGQHGDACHTRCEAFCLPHDEE